MIGKSKSLLLAVTGAIFIALGVFTDTHATEYASRTEWGYRDINYYNEDNNLGYHRTISGATWYYYEIPEDASYSNDERIYVPFNSNNPHTEKVAVPAKTCQSYGGFWALMRNEYKKTGENQGELTGRPAAAIRLSDVYVRGVFAGGANHIDYKEQTGNPEDGSGSIVAKKFGTWSEVKGDFEKFIGTSAIPDGVDWSPESSLSYFCAGNNPTQNDSANFASFSTVSMSNNYTSAPVINGQGYLSNSFIVPKGSTITLTFRHYIAKATDKPLSPEDSTISYAISGAGDASSGTVPVSALTEHINIGAVDYYAGAITQNITITADSKTTYCQAVSFNGSDPKSYISLKGTVVDGGEAKNSSACITIEPIEVSPNVVSSCDQGRETDPQILAENPIIAENGGVVPLVAGQATLGNTLATVGVSKNGVLQTTTAYNRNDVTTAYAKPGDAVQFSYALCFGAQNVKKGNGDHATGDDTSNNRKQNYFEVYVGNQNGAEDDSQGLLFGRAEDLLGTFIEVSINDTRAKALSNKSFWVDGSKNSPIGASNYYKIDNSKRQISFASPDDQPKSADGDGVYDCKFYSNLNTNSNTSTYQIPGFQSVADAPNCRSARITKSGNDTGDYMPSVVGATLSQTLSYFDVTYWPEYLGNAGPFDKGSANDDNYWGFHQADIQNFYAAYAAYKSGKHTRGGDTYNTLVDLYKTASVVIPYNFDTTISAEINNVPSSYVYPGDKVSISADVDILPRVNPLTSDSTGNDENGNPLHDVPYATITPPNTRVELIQFLVRDDADINSNTKYTYDDGLIKSSEATIKDVLNGKVDVFTKGSICNMYTGYLGGLIGECDSRTIKGYNYTLDDNKDMKKIGNPDSNPAGQMDYYHAEGDELTRVVPDIEAGYKYCVALGINHGDSHGVSGQSLSTDPNSKNYAANGFSVTGELNTSVKSAWKVTPASCRTIAKKPNFQVWNGGVHTTGDINTSISNPTVNTKLTTNHVPRELPDTLTDKQKAAAQRLFATNSVYFGSWAEYFVISNGTTRNFASAAALGYADPFNWYEIDKNQNRIKHESHLASIGVGSGQVSDFCNFSHLSIANTKCQSNNTAGDYAAESSIDSAILESYRERILKQYTDDLLDGVSNFQDKYSAAKDTAQYRTVNDASYLKIDTNNFIIDEPLVRGIGSGTLVIKVAGHLVIDENICLDDGSGTCDDGYGDILDVYTKDNNNLSLTGRNGISFAPSDIREIPQIILIAEDITISSKVSQVDAWLITSSDKSDYDGGYVNTCKEFRSNSTSTDTCWKTLKINGPIITTALLLNRTGGAWTGFAGDVGNPSYEPLRTQLENYVADTTIRLTELAREGASLPGDLSGYQTVYASALNVCRRYEDPTACYRRKFKVATKDYFIKYDPATGIERPIDESKAYKYSVNFSADELAISADNFRSRDLTCDGATTAAEIFDLHPLTYLWAYGQSLKSNQALVTYAQELAPRY